MIIEANIKNGDKIIATAKCDVNIPTSLDALCKAWGNDVVFEMACDSAIIKAQSKMRGLVSPKRTDGVMKPADVAKEMSTWKPTLRKAADPIGKVAAMLARLSPEERAIALGQSETHKPQLRKAKR